MGSNFPSRLLHSRYRLHCLHKTPAHKISRATQAKHSPEVNSTYQKEWVSNNVQCIYDGQHAAANICIVMLYLRLVSQNDCGAVQRSCSHSRKQSGSYELYRAQIKILKFLYFLCQNISALRGRRERAKPVIRYYSSKWMLKANFGAYN